MSKKEDYYFALTESGGRTNILSDFIVVDHETFIKKFLSNSGSGTWRYGKLGEPMDNIKNMSLNEYEIIFENTKLPIEVVTNSFRKEISLKYGKHKELSKIKPLKKSELVLGELYEDFSGTTYIYLGKATKLITQNFEYNEPSRKEGNAFVQVFKYDNFKIHPHSIDVIKGIKKLKSKVDIRVKNIHNNYIDKGYKGTVKYILHEFE